MALFFLSSGVTQLWTTVSVRACPLSFKVSFPFQVVFSVPCTNLRRIATSASRNAEWARSQDCATPPDYRSTYSAVHAPAFLPRGRVITGIRFVRVQPCVVKQKAKLHESIICHSLFVFKAGRTPSPEAKTHAKIRSFAPRRSEGMYL